MNLLQRIFFGKQTSVGGLGTELRNIDEPTASLFIHGLVLKTAEGEIKWRDCHPDLIPDFKYDTCIDGVGIFIYGYYESIETRIPKEIELRIGQNKWDWSDVVVFRGEILRPLFDILISKERNSASFQMKSIYDSVTNQFPLVTSPDKTEYKARWWKSDEERRGCFSRNFVEGEE
jgi:hypothetical protein